MESDDTDVTLYILGGVALLMTNDWSWISRFIYFYL